MERLCCSSVAAIMILSIVWNPAHEQDICHRFH
jgi:hypothetical protein